MTHPGLGWEDGKCCTCGITREELAKPELPPKNSTHLCTCGHVKGVHPKDAQHECERCDCAEYRCDHSRCGWRPREDKPDPKQLHKWKRCEQCRHPEHASACSVCRCLAVTSLEQIAATCRSAGGCPEHPESEQCQHPNKYNYGFASGPPAIRYFYCSACKAKWEEAETPEEPPMTPEEEEQAPCPHESWDVTSEWGDKGEQGEPTGKWWKSRRCNDCGEGLDNILEDEPHWDLQPAEQPPPQPERRPPYAVAYSVGGHLYEVAIPGDATVQAVDGALLITHALGPVAGIVRTAPLSNGGQPDV
jgi:hypothetical protein